MRRSVFCLLSVALVLVAARPDGARAAASDDYEIRIGRQGAATLEARFAVVADQAVQDRLNRIGRAITPHTERPRLPYTFKAVQVAQVNALALPGGFVYVTTGLLEFVRTDHELAAVIAHEVAHAARGHGLEMMRRANRAAFVTILIAVFTGDPALGAGAQVVATGLLAGYTRDLERDADLASIAYLTRTPYTPAGVLTVMERLRRLEQLSPRPDPGAFADHPTVEERIRYVEAELRARRIPINRRLAANYLALTVKETTEGGVTYAELSVNNRPIVRLPDVARIREAADLLDRLFDQDLEPYEVLLRESQGGWAILARGWPVLRFTAADAPGGSVRELAAAVHFRLRAAIEDDIRRRKLQG
ncbi:MAG: M48 family metalloprotease [Armatimonadota bacterium]|nr:M48 family metalloprotease [Armatimonadota bacterium]MDR7533239.1 M48 family metalloprotease [Armatimonadota bacterium]MDR7536968.1 M48 family metalloprotease [Armatimonadota bacterium]